MKYRLMFVCACVYTCVGIKAQSPFELGRGLEIFADIYRQLDMYYVDTLSADTAVRWAINGMLDEMDPYTVYYPADDNDDLVTMATGRYAGIGSIIRQHKKLSRCVIEEPYEGSPAQQAGLRAGDVILTIDGRDTKDWPVSQVSKNLRGDAGTTFELVVQRQGQRKPLTFKLTRRQIQTPSVPWYGMLDAGAGVGYIYLSSVTDQCSRDVRDAVTDLRQAGMKRLILDLRDNVGGSVREAVEIVGMFVPKGSLVVSTKGKVPATCTDYRTPVEPIDTLMPIAVMVNGGTASAAEIISGAMQDMDRAIVVGQRTYGKGIVQGIREVSYGGQLKLTTSRYYLPSGRCVQAYDYRRRVTSAAATSLPDSLTRAFKTRGGRIVRDGGGVLPDSILAVDSLPTMVYDLVASDAFFDYVTHYASEHATIAPAADFRLTDAEYAAFADSIASSDFTYNGRTAAALKQLRQLARMEGRLETAKAEFEALEARLMENDIRSDLMRAQEQVTPYLESEIVSRYYYQRGAMQRHALRNKDVRRTMEILKSEK